MTNAIAQIAVRHFGKAKVAKLAARGVRLVSTTVIPDAGSPMPFANGQTGYNVDDNGTGRLLTLREVLALV